MDVGERVMAVLALVVFGMAAFSQEPAGSAGENARRSDTSIIRGCLETERGNYILVENGSSVVYALKGIGNKLDKYLHHEVEVRGKMLPGTVKTGVRAQKVGDNPSDSVRAVSGVTFQVPDAEKDMRVTANHCKAADAQ